MCPANERWRYHCNVVSHWLGAYTKWSLQQLTKYSGYHRTANSWLKPYFKIPLAKWQAFCSGVNLLKQFNTFRLRQNGRHFADDPFKCIFLNETLRILIKMSLNFVPKGPINNIPALVQILAFTDAYMRHSASMSKVVVAAHLVILKFPSDNSERVIDGVMVNLDLWQALWWPAGDPFLVAVIVHHHRCTGRHDWVLTANKEKYK